MYKVPFVNYPEHCRRIWDEVMESIEEALSNGDLILRDQLRQFEEDVASFVGVRYEDMEYVIEVVHTFYFAQPRRYRNVA